MAQTTDSLVIDVSVNSNDVIKFFEVLSDKLNQLLGHAQQTGEKLDALGDSSDGINEVSSSLNEAGQNAKKTSKDLDNLGESGKKAGKDVSNASKGASKSLSQLDSTARRVFAAIKSYAAPLAAMFGAKLMFTNFIEEGDKLEKLSKEVRGNVTEIDAWRKANIAAGGSAEAFTSAMKSFTERTGASADVFLRMGKQLNGMTGAQANYALKYLGLTRESAAVFLQNNKQMNELVDKYRKMALTPKDAENARRFKTQWELTTLSMKNMGNQIARMFLPFVEKAVEKFGQFTDFIAEHSEFIKVALGVIGTAAALALGPRSALMLGSKAIALMTSPIGLTVAALIALAVALEDLISFAKGGPSAFEDLLRSLGSSDEEIKELRQSFQDAWKAIKELGEALEPIGKLLLQAFGTVAKAAIETIVITIGLIAAKIAKVIGSLSEFKERFVGAFESIKASVQPIIDWITDSFSSITNFKMPSWVNPKNWFGGGDKTPAAVAPAGAQAGNAAAVVKEAGRTTNINSPISNQTTVNINGNADREQVVQAVNEGVSRAMTASTDMVNNISSGVDH